MAIRDFAYRCCSIALSVHELSEVVCSLSIAGLERKIYFSRYVRVSPSSSFFRRRSVSARAFSWSSSNIVIEAGYLGG